MEKKMSFYEVIEKRRTIRQFDQEEIPKDVIERILNAGLKAPSGGGKRDWELLTITDKDIILDLAKFITLHPYNVKSPTNPQQEMLKIGHTLQKSMIEESTCIIIVLYKQKHEFSDSYNNFGLQEYASAWALIENILLAATYEGLGTGIHVPIQKEPNQIKEYMKIPYNYYIPAMILLGYAAENAILPTRIEANVEKNVHWNKW